MHERTGCAHGTEHPASYIRSRRFLHSLPYPSRTLSRYAAPAEWPSASSEARSPRTLILRVIPPRTLISRVLLLWTRPPRTSGLPTCTCASPRAAAGIFPRWRRRCCPRWRERQVRCGWVVARARGCLLRLSHGGAGMALEHTSQSTKETQ
jgi:hypothetical protein